jgi:hypothetical protein
MVVLKVIMWVLVGIVILMGMSIVLLFVLRMIKYFVDELIEKKHKGGKGKGE